MAGVTALLSAARRGDSGAESQLFALLYKDLRQLAHSRLRNSPSSTLLETTALVHEAYLRLRAAGYVKVADRSHFLAYAASAMRSIVVDAARKRGDALKAPDDPEELANSEDKGAGEREILRVHQALEELSAAGDRLVKVVEMRYFAGMKETEIAEALNITERTVRRDWEKARMMLSALLK